MPLEIRVQGEAVASRMADLVKIRIAFKSKGFYRNEASITNPQSRPTDHRYTSETLTSPRKPWFHVPSYF
jgi:hypothetical protein